MAITIFGWILIVIGIIFGIVGFCLGIYFAKGREETTLSAVVICIILAVLLIGGPLIYSLN